LWNFCGDFLGSGGLTRKKLGGLAAGLVFWYQPVRILAGLGQVLGIVLAHPSVIVTFPARAIPRALWFWRGFAGFFCVAPHRFRMLCNLSFATFGVGWYTTQALFLLGYRLQHLSRLSPKEVKDEGI
jgi:hypothetical protein